MISQHLQVYSSTTEYQRASLTILPTENYNLHFMEHKIPYLSSLLVTCHQSSRLYGVINKLKHEVSKNVVCANSKGSDQPAHMCSLIRAFASCLNLSVKLLADHHLEEAAQACLSLHLSKCHIVGNHMLWRIFFHLEKPMT